MTTTEDEVETIRTDLEWVDKQGNRFSVKYDKKWGAYRLVVSTPTPNFNMCYCNEPLAHAELKTWAEAHGCIPVTPEVPALEVDEEPR